MNPGTDRPGPRQYRGRGAVTARADAMTSVLDLVGWTPLIRLNRVTAGMRTPVYGKAEFMNPGGSVKDRIGIAIIRSAEDRGLLRPGGTVVEGTSGNTGLALAMAAASRGYRCIFTMPDKMSREKVKLLRAFGAEVVITPTAVSPDHPDHYVNRARAIAEATPGAFLADQFENRDNPEAHYLTTGPELWRQTDGGITHFVAGAGTGGTISGTARHLKERNPEIRVIGVDPVGSVISGYHRTGEVGGGEPYKVEGLGNDRIPGTLDVEYIDEYRTVTDAEAFAMARRLVREEGLFVGGSTGLIVHAALEESRTYRRPRCPGRGHPLRLGRALPHQAVRRRVDAQQRLPGAQAGHGGRDGGGQARTAAGAAHGDARDAGAHGRSRRCPRTTCRSSRSWWQENASVASRSANSWGRCWPIAPFSSRRWKSVMGPPYPVVDEGAGADAATRLLTRGAHAVLIRSHGSLDGILTRYDLVRSLAASP